MKSYLKSTRSKIALVVGVAIFCYWAVSGVFSIKDRIEVAKMTQEMKTVCVGRFLIDMPDNAHVVLRRARISGFDISTYPNDTEDKFAARMEKRESALSAKKNELGQNNIELVHKLKGDGMIGKIFLYEKSHVRDVDIYEMEGFAYMNGTGFSFYSDLKDKTGVEKLINLINKIVPLPVGAIPNEPGFCINGALVRDPLAPDQIEQVGLFASLPGHADLFIAFHTHAGIVTGPNLLARNASVEASESAYIRAHFTTLREGSRSINGVPGVELLQKVREENFTTGHDFQWESIGKHNDVLLPQLGLELETGRSLRQGGRPVQSSLSDAALLDLWNKISSSVRVRPTKPPKVAEVPPPEIPPLGTYASAYTACPQSGWWQCGDNGPNIKICGGQTQYLRKGECVPQAIILTEPTLWQRFKREEPSYRSEIPTAWKLVDYRKNPRQPPAFPLEDAGPGKLGMINSPHIETAGSDDVGSKTRMGQSIDTGTACPESGWWRCAALDAIDRTRWFGRGRILPAATFHARRTWADKLRGAAEVERLHSVWQFVRHDQGITIDGTAGIGEGVRAGFGAESPPDDGAGST